MEVFLDFRENSAASGDTILFLKSGSPSCVRTVAFDAGLLMTLGCGVGEDVDA